LEVEDPPPFAGPFPHAFPDFPIGELHEAVFARPRLFREKQLSSSLKPVGTLRHPPALTLSARVCTAPHELSLLPSVIAFPQSTNSYFFLRNGGAPSPQLKTRFATFLLPPPPLPRSTLFPYVYLDVHYPWFNFRGLVRSFSTPFPPCFIASLYFRRSGSPLVIVYGALIPLEDVFPLYRSTLFRPIPNASRSRGRAHNRALPTTLFLRPFAYDEVLYLSRRKVLRS